VHYRQNRYDAAVHIIAVDGAWKIREIETLDERRLLDQVIELTGPMPRCLPEPGERSATADR
jgi:hypothetical protein